MEKLLVVVLICLSSISFAQITDSNLPIVIINTSNGQSVPDQPRVAATMKILYAGEGLRNFFSDQNNATKLNYNGKIRIEVRGSSSQSLEKKQYGLTTVTADGTTNNNVSLLGMPKENDWILNGLAFDPSLIRDYLSYNLSIKLGNYAPRQRYCEVVLNNVYQGLYILQEKVKIDDNRVNVAKIDPADNSLPELSGGYLIKADKVTNEDPSSWTMSTYGGWQTDFILESPKPSEISGTQKSYISNVFFELAPKASNATISTGFPSVIDVPSFVDFMIINELAANVDAYQFSTYFHKERQGKLRAGPLWDLNLTYGNDLFRWNLDRSKSDNWQFDNGDNTGPKFWRDLYNNPTFRCYLSKRWNGLTAPGQPLHIDELSIFIDQIVANISEAAVRENDHWFSVGIHSVQIDAVKSFISARIAWMTANLGSFSVCSNVTKPPLVIHRIHYHPETEISSSEDGPEFIEIINTSSSAVSLTGVYFSGTGLGFQFESGTMLPGNAVIQLTDNKGGFHEKYGYTAFGEYARKLSNSSQKLTLADAFGNVIDEVQYNDATPWPDADGNGMYIKLTDAALDNNAAENWIASNEAITSTEIILGVDDESENVEISPNPAENVVQIKSPRIMMSVSLTDARGKNLETKFALGFETQIDLRKYPSGLYLIRIQSEHDQTIVKKVVKK